MVISLCCGKGGTGKTTSTCNIGAALAEHGKRVLLIDNDQQGSLRSRSATNHQPCQVRWRT